MELSVRRGVSGENDHSPLIRHIYRAMPISHPLSPKQQIDKERRLRRQVANNNERRRMQSINNGFDQLRQMLPLGEREKFISKSALLQATIHHISNLYEERERLLDEVKQLKQFIRDRFRIEPEGASPAISSEGECPEESEACGDYSRPDCGATSVPTQSEYHNALQHRLSPSTGMLCATVNDNPENCKNALQYELDDRLSYDSVASASAVSIRPSHPSAGTSCITRHAGVSSSRTHVPTESLVNIRRENVGHDECHQANQDFADAGRSNLEIILTAIQHIERSGHEAVPSSKSNGLIGTDEAVPADKSIEKNDDPVNIRNSVTSLVQTSTPNGRNDLGRPQQVQRIPTLLLHRVTRSDISSNLRAVASVSQKSNSSSRVTHQTSNILVINHPTVTLTGADGGEMQYHLAAVTK